MEIAAHLKIGLMNDLHYDGSVEALNRLYESVAMLNQGGTELLVILGDLLDSTGEGNALRLLREVSALCDSFKGTVRYMPGNHDLDHLSKTQFFTALGHAADSSTCSFKHGGVDLICIDGNFSPKGTEYDHGNYDWKESFIPNEQLEWLEAELVTASQPAIILSHQRLDIAGMHSVRNHEAVQHVIQKSGKVAAVFQGHQHADDVRQIEGTAYYTLSAHKDDAGPALVHIDSKGVRLVRDFRTAERV
jgi:predicted phosphodiesterase